MYRSVLVRTGGVEIIPVQDSHGGLYPPSLYTWHTCQMCVTTRGTPVINIMIHSIIQQ